MDTVFYMILTLMSTIIDQKIIEFELLIFELCLFLQKYGSLHSNQDRNS